MAFMVDLQSTLRTLVRKNEELKMQASLGAISDAMPLRECVHTRTATQPAQRLAKA
jgi:hypothetical protein